ncbi:hypothetical protein [Klebsiella aerogenes]|uniref:Cytoplasmic protein n=1 Tax=Klebsiella aerogenes TaxID=548 RepID=A0AAP9R221_KLEAE|nr:hypothetical protein [Klebsiella aerogenes]QMR42990.1 hypothetical protein HV331_26235 [Klebsiella aerogenes]
MDDGLREAVRQAQGYFNSYHRYPIERLEADYQDEIRKFSNESWEAPQRAARLSAAVKNYKTSQMLSFIFEIGIDHALDLTPLVVKRLCQNLFGRKGSQAIIVDVFGSKQRIHRSIHSSPVFTDELTERYRRRAEHYWRSTLTDIERVKLGYRKKVNKANAKNSTQDG